MRRIIRREDGRVVIGLLRQRQPRTFEDFKEAFRMREFEVRRLLKNLEAENVIIRESLSGEEKFWLNEAQAFDFLGKNPVQKKRLKHVRGM